MKTIKVWSVDRTADGDRAISQVEMVQQTETETQLEEILVEAPELLMDSLVLVGRQTPTAGGPLDLLGVDEDGRLTIFELKRGTLTRDAVAQVVDYASDLHELSREQLCQHIEDRSGEGGIPKIDDFEAWYLERHVNERSCFDERPKMVLVGLGADDRTRRMVEFLSAGGVEISLITFHGFQENGRQFFARQEEVSSGDGAAKTGRRYTKKENTATLRALAERLGSIELFDRMRSDIAATINAYEWPSLSTATYYLTRRTESGNPTQRAYITLCFSDSRRGQVQLGFHERAIDAVGDKFEEFSRSHSERDGDYWGGKGFWFSSPEDWTSCREDVLAVLSAMIDGWRAQDSSES